MKKYENLREQFLQEPLAIQLSMLATNFARIDAYIRDTQNELIIRHLVDEARHVIEWMVPSLSDIDHQCEFANIQRQLTSWLYRWQLLWVDPVQRVTMAQTARQWSVWTWHLSGIRDAVAKTSTDYEIFIT